MYFRAGSAQHFLKYRLMARLSSSILGSQPCSGLVAFICVRPEHSADSAHIELCDAFDYLRMGCVMIFTATLWYLKRVRRTILYPPVFCIESLRVRCSAILSLLAVFMSSLFAEDSFEGRNILELQGVPKKLHHKKTNTCC